MSTFDSSPITKNALWNQNPALVQMLGICPLLAISNTFLNALFLGLATSFVMAISGFCGSYFKKHIPDSIRLPLHIFIIATTVGVIELLWEAFFPELYEVVGIFIALITTNCIVLARVEAFARHNTIKHAIQDGLMMGLGSTCILITLGTLREVLMFGTIGRGIHMIITGCTPILIFSHPPSFILASLPSGAFFILALLVALKQKIDQSRHDQ